MEIEENKPQITITLGTQTRYSSIDLKSEITRIIVTRKKPKQQTNRNEERFNTLQRMVFPSVRRLSIDHALLVITKRNTTKLNKFINFVLKGRLNINLLDIIGNYLCSKVEITIRDLNSKCGSYIPKNRPLKTQQFWLMSKHQQLSFGIYFLSTPGQHQNKIQDTSLIQYIQRSANLISDDNVITKKAKQCKLFNSEQIKIITKTLLQNYCIAVLSHNSKGYVFILNPQKPQININDYFIGKLTDSKLYIESDLQLYTNICKQRPLKQSQFSDAYKIKSKQTLILGQQKCRLQVKYL